MIELSLEFEIGIVEYRNIIKVVKETYNYDFSDYALTSLKRRFERIMQLYRLRNTEVFIERLREDKSFFQLFLQEVSIESTEMFRDPSFWRYLRDETLPSLFKDTYRPKIWFPSNVSGEEIFTFCIVLKENGWFDKCDILATSLNDSIIERIRSGSFRNTKVEASADNYDRYQGIAKLNNYYTTKGELIARDSSLIKNVNFIKQNINFDNPPLDVKLIICRNQLIYFSQSLHDVVIKLFHDSLIMGGYLIIGNKELLGSAGIKYFKGINEDESIYKKI
jgi:chemotaxis protein methyltransferase CheR